MSGVSSATKSHAVRIVLLILLVLTSWLLAGSPSTSLTAENVSALVQPRSLCPDFEIGKTGPVLQVPQNFPTIQAAIDAAPEDATIQIAAGIYEENLVIRKHLRLQGVSRDQVILKSPLERVSNILIVSSYGVGRYKGLGVVIEGLTTRGAFVGVEVVGTPLGVLIRNNVFLENGVGILALPAALPSPFLLAVDSGSIYICENAFESQSTGIYAIPLDLHYLLIRGNDFRNVDDGIRVEKGAVTKLNTPRVEISKNTMQGSSIGVLLLESSRVLVSENTIAGVRGRVSITGVTISGSEAILEGNIIRGQAIGVEMSNGHALFKGNKIENNGQSGAQFISGGVRVVAGQAEFLENQIINNLGYGILVRRIENVAVCQGNQVTGNSIADYGVDSPIGPPQPSPELKQKCEGS